MTQTHHVLRCVSIPFIAGQWSLPEVDSATVWRPGVSIPFIAGQWSLLNDGPTCGPGGDVSIPFIAGQWSLRFGPGQPTGRGPIRFNPLHCGAVVASHGYTIRFTFYRPVSIPFIAGQWSLLAESRTEIAQTVEFQSPSLRGSGRFCL